MEENLPKIKSGFKWDIEKLREVAKKVFEVEEKIKKEEERCQIHRQNNHCS